MRILSAGRRRRDRIMIFTKLIVSIIGIVLLLLFCLAFVAYNYLHTKGKKKMFILITSIIIVAIPFIMGYALHLYSKSITPSDHNDRVCGCEYLGEEDGYYIFCVSSLRTADYYAVPNNTDTPLIFKENSLSDLYLMREYPEEDNTYLDLSQKYTSNAQILDDNTVIVMNYIFTDISLMYAALFVFMVFHLFALICLSDPAMTKTPPNNINDPMQ